VIGGASASGRTCKACVKRGVRCVFEGKGGNLERGVGGNRKEKSTREDLVVLGEEEIPMDVLLTSSLNPNDIDHDSVFTDKAVSPDALLLQPYRRSEGQTVGPIEDLFTTPVANSQSITTSKTTAPTTDGGLSYPPSYQEFAISPRDINDLAFLNEEDFDYDYTINIELNPILAPTFPSPLSSFLTTPSSWLLTHFTPNAGQDAAQKIILTMMIDVIRTYPLMYDFLSSSPCLPPHLITKTYSKTHSRN